MQINIFFSSQFLTEDTYYLPIYAMDLREKLGSKFSTLVSNEKRMKMKNVHFSNEQKAQKMQKFLESNDD